MKKLAVILVLLALVGAASAEIKLGAFPIGDWLDANYNAVWSFTTGNIKIVDPAGNLYYDFGDKTLTNFTVDAKTTGVALTFTCTETGKTYTLTKPLSGTGLVLKIVREGKPDYTVDMPKQ